MDVVKWIVVAVVVLAVLGWLFRKTFGAADRAVLAATHEGEQVLDPRADQLRYTVPVGQDPVVLIAALARDGYDAVTVLEGGRHHVVVTCPAGPDRDRAHVRAIIRSASQTSPEGNAFSPGEVRFDDETADDEAAGDEATR